MSKDSISFAGGDVNLYAYVWNQPIDWKDPTGQNPAAGVIIGGALGGPPGAVAGAIIGTGLGVGIGWLITHNNGQDAGNDAKAPGVPTAEDGYKQPRDWNGGTVPNPNGPGRGYPDKGGKVWCPTGPGPNAHGGPHWDVQNPDGTHVNVYPGGKTR